MGIRTTGDPDTWSSKKLRKHNYDPLPYERSGKADLDKATALREEEEAEHELAEEKQDDLAENTRASHNTRFNYSDETAEKFDHDIEEAEEERDSHMERAHVAHVQAQHLEDEGFAVHNYKGKGRSFLNKKRHEEEYTW
jgi:hypothetical protein